ncbi:MAG: pyridoxamine 5'-phosphate oxidase family protein [Candidatus Methanoplasma sp.]|jgi:uncharacterized pyridoxamine 5'-phosphate oxidase family protein|nr:pyridoxamine 5'-phosphate oxidase family protein [Candidatus Methanoplasma sp.]
MDKVLKLLKENCVMNLATSSGDKPRSSIMEYVMAGNDMIFATNPETIKAKNLAKNPKLSLTVGGMPIYVAIDGTVTEPGQKEIEAYKKGLFGRHPEFEGLINSGVVKFKYYKVVFETAYYTEGMGPAQIIKAGK